MEKSDMSQDGRPSVMSNNWVDDTVTCNDTKKPNINIESEIPERNVAGSGALITNHEHGATAPRIDDNVEDGATTLNIDDNLHADGLLSRILDR